MVFIVIEGLDGAGGETQTNLLLDYFNKIGKKAVKIESPNLNTPVGKAYREYLYEKFEMKNEAIFLLCACDVIINRKTIEENNEKGNIIIADRYITSTIAYQAANKFPFEKALKIVELIDFPKPDMIIYIDISPETSMRRKAKEKGNLDRHEKNLEYLKKVREFYKKEIDRNVLGKWFMVDGEQPIDKIHRDIVETIKNELNLF